jgi:NurA-like 5'-3' nuclease
MANGITPPSVKIGDYLLKFEEEELGEEYKERARKELRETPEVVSDAITAFKGSLRGEHTS